MGMFFPGGRVPQPSYYLTAYDVAKRHGYRGSEADFAAALIRAASDKTEFWCITPEMYGAYGDGQTDDTDAIRTAIEAAIEQDVPLVCNGTYIVTKTGVIDCPGNLTMIGTGTFKRKDDFITNANNGKIILNIEIHAKSHVLIEGLTFDGNRAGQHLDTDISHYDSVKEAIYNWQSCHSVMVRTRENGGTVIYRNLHTQGRIGDGFNVSTYTINPDEPVPGNKRSYRLDYVLFDNITGCDSEWARADCCVTAPCKMLVFRNCDVGHLETELNTPEDGENTIICSGCHVSEWLELGYYQAINQKVYLSDVSLDSGLLSLAGKIFMTNCNLRSDLSVNLWHRDDNERDNTSYIQMYGGLISNSYIECANILRIYGYASNGKIVDVHIKNCRLKYTGDQYMLNCYESHNDIVIDIEGCTFEGKNMLYFGDGIVRLANNTVFGQLVSFAANRNFNYNDSLTITGNDIHNGTGIAYDFNMPKTTTDWTFEFACFGNRIYGNTAYIKVYKWESYYDEEGKTRYRRVAETDFSKLKSFMRFTDTFYCPADTAETTYPAQPFNGATYIQPAGVIKVATTNAASGLKTVSLA